MRIGLIPLDERPVNTRYPAMLAAVADVTLEQPPPNILSQQKTPAHSDALAGWLLESAGRWDALIVACEQLAYGGLIASRTSQEPLEVIAGRLGILREVKARHPALTIAGFNVITRIPHYDSAAEEPDYWAEYGARLHHYSALLDRRAQGESVQPALDELAAALPAPVTGDFLRRRLRNHTLNLAALGLLAEDVFDLLVISSDDTSPYGLGSREKRWLAEWAGLVADPDRLLMYPGADEVGCVLLARLVNAGAGRAPAFAVDYALPGGEAVIAPYEDGPIALTVERQIRAVGGQLAADGLRLAVNTPVERRGEYDPAHAPAERAAREPHLRAQVGRMKGWLAAGEPVLVADVAYPNGADPLLMELLRAEIDLPALLAYGGWNTAGNTIGTVLAQGCLAQHAASSMARQAQERFLLHRLLEDWAYQHVARPELQAWLLKRTGSPETTPESQPMAEGWIENRLNALIAELPGFAGRYRLARGSVRLPWGRTFEVDFGLQLIPGRAG